MSFALLACMDDSSALERMLLLLGTSPAAVATTLKANGIKGVRNTVRDLNPIVRFAQARLPIDRYRLDVRHGDGMESYFLRVTLPTGTEQQVELPESVKQFLDEFNRGAFEELELA
jgi:hypothetical protein